MNIIERYKRLPRLTKILLLGILIRLILMPFFGHKDILSTYERAYTAAFEGVNVFHYTQPLSHIIEVINLWFYDLFFDRTNLLPFSPFIEINPHIRLNMFMFKLPYLFFDVATCLVLFRLGKKEEKFRVLKLYFLNPLVIFAVYIFGRYESIPIFFLSLMILMIKEKKYAWSALSFAMVILSRTSLLILFPVALLSVGKTYWDKIKFAAISLLPYATVFLYKLVFLKELGEAKWVTQGHHLEFFFNMQFNINYNEFIYLFFVVSGVFLIFVLNRRFLKDISWHEVSGLFLIQLFIYYAFANYHPQYLAWMAPFLALFVANSKELTRNMVQFLFLASVTLIPLLLTWSPATYFEMFGPIGEWISSFSLEPLFESTISGIRIANVARSFMFSLFIYFGILILKNYHSKYKKQIILDNK